MNLFSNCYFYDKKGVLREGVIVATTKEAIYVENYGWIPKEECYETFKEANERSF